MIISKKKMTLIAYVFRILQTVKDVVRQMSVNSCLRRPCDKQHCKRLQTLLKSERQKLYQIHRSLWKKLSYKKSLFGIGNILALFVNTLTADEKYTLLSGFNLTQPIQMQLPKKQKVVCQIFSEFLKSISNFEQFEKKDDPHSLCIFESNHCKRRC